MSALRTELDRHRSHYRSCAGSGESWNKLLVTGPLAVVPSFLKVGDLLLVASLFVLGGEFWDKLKSLFVYGAKVQCPASQAVAGPGNRS